MSNWIDLRELAEELEELREKVLNDEDFDDEDEERLAMLEKLDEEDFNGDLAGYAENEPTAIPEWEFEDYCQELAEDCGYLGSGSDRDRNPLLNYIDWEAWARDCKYDYTEFEFDGSTYLVRSW